MTHTSSCALQCSSHLLLRVILSQSFSCFVISVCYFCLTSHSYNKGRSLDAFLEFIKEKLDADKGFARVEALDKLAQAFVAEGADKDKVAADVKAAAAKVDKEQAANAKLYVEAIEKALARVSGCGWVGWMVGMGCCAGGMHGVV